MFEVFHAITTLSIPINVCYYLELRNAIMFEQLFDLSSAKIELVRKMLLHFVTPNSNTQLLGYLVCLSELHIHTNSNTCPISPCPPNLSLVGENLELRDEDFVLCKVGTSDVDNGL